MDAVDVIGPARALDVSFTPNLHPNRVCYEFLTRYQRKLAAKMLQREPKSISQGISIPLPLADFLAGELLAAAPGEPLQYDRLHGVSAVLANGAEAPVHIIPYVARFQPDRWPFGWIQGGRIFLGGREGDWTGSASIEVEYAPTAGAVTGDDTTLVLPDSALDAAVLALGAELALRRPKEVERTTLPAEAAAAEVDYLNLIEEREGQVEVGTVRRVFS